MLFKRIEALLKRCESGSTVMPPTHLYNEGWMLKLTLDRFESLDLGDESHPLTVPSGCRWYSEALLPSAFLAKPQGESSGEKWTHADGVIGHFDIGNDAKGDLTLRAEAKHFVVIEAKMFSKLSAGVKNAPYFDQAARNVACITEVLKRAGRKPQEFKSLGFYVLAPECQIKRGLFREKLTKTSLRSVVERRVTEFSDNRNEWLSEWFLPVLEKLEINEISWEDLLEFIPKHDAYADQLRDFYRRCLQCNKPRKRP